MFFISNDVKIIAIKDRRSDSIQKMSVGSDLSGCAVVHPKQTYFSAAFLACFSSEAYEKVAYGD